MVKWGDMFSFNLVLLFWIVIVVVYYFLLFVIWYLWYVLDFGIVYFDGSW